jgi:DNA-binding transcriptional ArsR family regulator
MQASDPLSTTFAALADPTRRAILARLAEGEASVGELAAPFDMSMPAVSKHLKVLERAALIRRTKVAQWRRCALRADGFRDAARWLEHYERFWTESLDRLAAYLDEQNDQPDRASHSTGSDPTTEENDGDGSTKAR